MSFKGVFNIKRKSALFRNINSNKHLPGIPSAQEYAERGKVSIGELQLKLLEKVEELTRYVIDLKKENTELKVALEKLKK